jgi:hypothetical protein
VAIALGHGNQFIAIENRFDDSDIGEMRASDIGIIDGNDVFWIEIVFKIVQNRFGCEMERPDMDSNVMGSLCHGIPIRIIQAATEIAIVDHEGVTGSQNLLAHHVHQVDKGAS